MSLFKELPYVTTRIETINATGDRSFGTGFYYIFKDEEYGSAIFVLTNKHVVDGAQKIKITFSIGNNNVPVPGRFFGFEADGIQDVIIRHPDPEIDLAAFPIGGVLNDLSKRGVEVFLRSLSDEIVPSIELEKTLGAGEEVHMVGYPSGIWDEKNNFPIIRRGITATPYNSDYNGRCEFVIDAACIPGSSGSPIIIANEGPYSTPTGITIGSRLLLIGLLWGGPQLNAEGSIVAKPVPTSVEPMVLTRIPINLGYCVKARAIRDLYPIVKKLISAASGIQQAAG